MLSFATSSRVGMTHLLDSRSVAGVCLVDALCKLRFMMRPVVNMAFTTDPPALASVVLNASNSHLVPVMVGPQALNYVLLIDSRRNVPTWAISGRELTTDVMEGASFDSTGYVNPTLFAIPMVCPFSFGLPYADSQDLFDRGIQEQLAEDYGEIVGAWAVCMAGALKDKMWVSVLEVYAVAKQRDLLDRFLGDRTAEILPFIHEGEPILSMVPLSESAHSSEVAALKHLLGPLAAPVPGVAVTAAASLPASPSTICVVSSEERQDEAVMKMGQRRLLLISLVATFDADAVTLTNPKFPTPMQAYIDVLAEKSKAERVQALKMLLDTANSLRNEDNKYNQLVTRRDCADHDVLIILAFLTGSFAMTPMQDLDKQSSSFSLMNFLPLGKERVNALRGERLAHEMERIIGECDANRTKKRTQFSEIGLITSLDQVMSMVANALSAWQALFACTKPEDRPLVVVALLKLFDILVDPRTQEWWMEHRADMDTFPTYLALRVDKFCCGMVEAACHYQNDRCAKLDIVADLDLEVYLKPLRVFFNDMKDVKKYVDHEKPWDIVQGFLQRSKKVKSSATSPTSVAAVPAAAGAAAGGSVGSSVGNSVGASVGNGGAGSHRPGARRFGGGSASFGTASSDAKAKGCFVLRGHDAAFSALCPEARAIYCANFSTVGRECTYPVCRFRHSWYNKFDASVKEKQLAYVAANQDKVLFNNDSEAVKRALPTDKHFLLGTSAGPVSAGEN